MTEVFGILTFNQHLGEADRPANGVVFLAKELNIGSWIYCIFLSDSNECLFADQYTTSIESVRNRDRFIADASYADYDRIAYDRRSMGR